MTLAVLRIAALLAFVSTARPVAAEPEPIDLRYEDGRITASLEAVPNDEVLERIAAVTGAHVEGAVVAPRVVTAALEREPLERVLERILGEQNFAVRYGADDQVKSITLLGGPLAAPPPPAEVPAVEPVPAEEAPERSPAFGFPLELSRALERHRPLPVPEPLAEAMGVENATFPELLDTATLDENGVVRAQATQVVLSAIEQRGRLRRSFLRTLHRLDEPTFAAIAASEAGPNFEGILEYLAIHSREPSIQKKASIVLEQLQVAAAPAEPATDAP